MKKILLVLLALLLMVVIGLQGFAAGQKSLWEDETITARAAQGDFGDLVQFSHKDLHPPLHYMVFSAWGRTFGYSELALRSLSILFVVVTLLFVYVLAQDMFTTKIAWIAVLLLAVSPFLLMYGHNVRYYSMAAALTLLVILFMYRFQASNHWSYWLLYILASAAFLYTIYAAFAVILACFLWGVVDMSHKKERRMLLAWLLAHIMIALIFGLMLPIIFSKTGSWIDLSTGKSNLAIEFLKRAAYLGYAFGIGETLSPVNPVAWLGIAIIVLIFLGMMVKFRQFTHNAWFLLFILVFVLSFNIVINAITKYPQSAIQALPHRSLYVYPFFIILLAYGITLFKNKLLWIGLGAGLFLVFAAGTFNYFMDREFMMPVLTVPWRTMMEQIQETTGDEAAVVCNRADHSCHYYARRYGYEPRKIGICKKSADQVPAEVWWIHSNLGTSVYNQENEILGLENCKSRYRTLETYHFGLHDPSIRQFKVKFLGRQDYEYRVVVYRLHDPIQP